MITNFLFLATLNFVNGPLEVMLVQEMGSDFFIHECPPCIHDGKCFLQDHIYITINKKEVSKETNFLIKQLDVGKSPPASFTLITDLDFSPLPFDLGLS